MFRFRACHAVVSTKISVCHLDTSTLPPPVPNPPTSTYTRHPPHHPSSPAPKFPSTIPVFHYYPPAKFQVPAVHPHVTVPPHGYSHYDQFSSGQQVLRLKLPRDFLVLVTWMTIVSYLLLLFFSWDYLQHFRNSCCVKSDCIFFWPLSVIALRHLHPRDRRQLYWRCNKPRTFFIGNSGRCLIA